MISDEKIKEVWDGFGPEGQNMPFTQFRAKMRELTDERRMLDDLGTAQARIAREQAAKRLIDRAMN